MTQAQPQTDYLACRVQSCRVSWHVFQLQLRTGVIGRSECSARLADTWEGAQLLPNLLASSGVRSFATHEDRHTESLAKIIVPVGEVNPPQFHSEHYRELRCQPRGTQRSSSAYHCPRAAGPGVERLVLGTLRSAWNAVTATHRTLSSLGIL